MTINTPRHILEETRLSTGRLLQLSKYGHRHTVILGSLQPMEAPTLHQGLLKAEALQIYADYLQSDVMETA